MSVIDKIKEMIEGIKNISPEEYIELNYEYERVKKEKEDEFNLNNALKEVRGSTSCFDLSRQDPKLLIELSFVDVYDESLDIVLKHISNHIKNEIYTICENKIENYRGSYRKSLMYISKYRGCSVSTYKNEEEFNKVNTVIKYKTKKTVKKSKKTKKNK